MYNAKAEVVTDNYDSSGKYAKVMEIPVEKYGYHIYINTFNMSFRVIWVNGFSDYKWKDYSLSLSGPSTIVFNEMTQDTKGYDVKAVIKDKVCSIYVSSDIKNASVQVKLLHSNQPNWITFTQLEKFTEDFTDLSPINPVKTYGDVLPTLNGGWEFTDNVTNNIKKIGSTVILNLDLKPGIILDGYALAKIPIGYSPSKSITHMCYMKKSDDTFDVGSLKITSFGDIIVHGITSGVTTELYINLTYTT